MNESADRPVTQSDDSDFLDVRQHGFARVAVCVPETRVGNPQFNAAAHLRQLDQAHRAGAHYALCPDRKSVV